MHERSSRTPANSNLGFASNVRVPGGALVSWAPALAAVTLWGNDAYFKKYHAGWLSGKLSDVAINFLLPVLLVALCEWVCFATQVCRGRPWHPMQKTGIAVCCFATALYFSMLQIAPPFIRVHSCIVNLLSAGSCMGPLRANTPDFTDLLTLAATPLSAIYLAARRGSHRQSPWCVGGRVQGAPKCEETC